MNETSPGGSAGRGRRLRAARRVAVLVVTSAALAGCGSLLPQATPPPAFYALDAPGAHKTGKGPRQPAPGAPTLLVQAPRAAAGYDSAHIVYTRQAHRLESFAHSEWVEPPARMLAPLIVGALQGSGAFAAVALSPGAFGADLVLDTEILRLQQEFAVGAASQVRFTLRAYLVERSSRMLLAWHEFDRVVAAASDDPQGGVAAANLAVREVLEQLATLCAEAAGPWQAARAAAPAPAGSSASKH